MKRSLSGRLATPPPLSAVLRWMVDWRIVKGPLEEFMMPPPWIWARLSWTVMRSKLTRMPLFSMPPPSAPALLFLTTLSAK